MPGLGGRVGRGRRDGARLGDFEDVEGVDVDRVGLGVAAGEAGDAEVGPFREGDAVEVEAIVRLRGWMEVSAQAR